MAADIVKTVLGGMKTFRYGAWLAMLGTPALLAAPLWAQSQGYESRESRCQQLERQLVSEWRRGNSPQNAVTNLDQQLQKLNRERRAKEVEAERRDCYDDFFIFGRSLRQTKECVKLDGQVERLRRDIANLRQQREALASSAQRRRRRDDLVAELARYGCGENYEREYSARRQRNTFSFWEDEDTSFDRGYVNETPDQSALPFASYRTMCVRLCDGFYFPISFSTLGSRFAQDEQQCKSQCAAPAELFVYRNPGEDVEQMVSLNGVPYNKLRNAWRHRKEYIKGCSCKPQEYSAHQIALSEEEKRKQAHASPAPQSSAPPSDVGGADAPASGTARQ